jgi:hypothetical protein
MGTSLAMFLGILIDYVISACNVTMDEKQQRHNLRLKIKSVQEFENFGIKILFFENFPCCQNHTLQRQMTAFVHEDTFGAWEGVNHQDNLNANLEDFSRKFLF